MGVLEVYLKPGRRANFNEKFDRRYTLTYGAETSDPADGAAVVRADPRVPQIGQAYQHGNEADEWAWCRELTVTNDVGRPTTWTIEATFDTERDSDTSLNNENPLFKPPEVSWGYTEEERPFVRDQLNNPVLNSASDRFDPLPTFNESPPVLTISRNVPVYNPYTIILYRNAINSDRLIIGGYTVQPGQAKMESITIAKQFEGGIIFWKESYEIHFRAEGWDEYILDCGFRDASGRPFRDPLDQSILPNPTLLNGRGAKLTTATTPVRGPTDATLTVFTTDIAATDIAILTFVSDAGKFPASLNYPDTPFEIQIGANPQEIMLVTSIVPINNTYNAWFLQRGYRNTPRQAYTRNSSIVMLPYYRRYKKFKSLPFSALALPLI